MPSKRKSSITKRLQKMRGLDRAEKRVLIQLGELVDGIINNRAPTNPQLEGRTRSNVKLPPPNAITNESGIRTSKLSWPAIDSSILSHYLLDITNFDSGTTETFISYTNSFIFKGREGGNYKALVKSVGRNGTTSEAATITFFMPENVMLLEGTKNGINTIGAQVSENFYFMKGHKVFVWGAFTLDRLIGSASTGNSTASISLYRSEKDLTLNDATLVQTISLYAATESATNLDSTALGGGILRPDLAAPASFDPDYVRGNSYETCHSVMFGPITVTDDLADREHNLFLVVTGREDENDVASLSLTVWSANEGQSNEIPADPFDDSEPAITTGHRKSISIHEDKNTAGDLANEWLHGTVPSNFNFIGDTFTFACWIKLRRISYAQAATSCLIYRWEPTLAAGDSFTVNMLKISLTRNFSGIDANSCYVETRIEIGGYENSASPGNPINTGTWQERNPIAQLSANANNPDADPPYELSSTDPIWPLGINDWHFFVVTFNPDDGVRVWTNGIEKPDPSIPTGFPGRSNNTVGVTPNVSGGRIIVWGGEGDEIYASGSDIVFDGPTDTPANPLTAKLHMAGMWNKNLTDLEIINLYNNGAGTERNWRENNIVAPGIYESAGNLLHYWQFGAVYDNLKYVGRDTGINPLGSGGNDGDIDLTETGANPPTTQLFATGFNLTNVVDDYPQ